MVYFHKRLLVLVSGLSISATSLIAASKSAPSRPHFYNPCHRNCHEFAIGQSQRCAGLYPRSDPTARPTYFRCLCTDFVEFENSFDSCVRLGEGNFGACKYPQDVFDREGRWCDHYV
ncbi:BZ3500_MvSof-1268-A1-R1_Chr11-3g03588 [Microbotryum saponariae]|uniref:BZ3500_MvSof-1268-A1-R1_Chr11-3g03588 protein n=1 Tax=Microbotryum saponariae TaxID=289078 RepID=A0A2X0NES3_9BASI|nr:BZ3500_MvSof-1268-A1-R1_Chr11-3g03588 [Microbotryum saponariae]SDA03597.1 BZ3501_MvSof-1269-A2-R1_Chr11g03165 [Microbotryum saponariae]